MTTNEALLFGGSSDVPIDVATCPECGGQLRVISMSWGDQTGVPLASALDVWCKRDHPGTHRWFQSEWQKGIDAIRQWAGAVGEAELRD